MGSSGFDLHNINFVLKPILGQQSKCSEALRRDKMRHFKVKCWIVPPSCCTGMDADFFLDVLSFYCTVYNGQNGLFGLVLVGKEGCRTGGMQERTDAGKEE